MAGFLPQMFMQGANPQPSPFQFYAGPQMQQYRATPWMGSNIRGGGLPRQDGGGKGIEDEDIKGLKTVFEKKDGEDIAEPVVTEFGGDFADESISTEDMGTSAYSIRDIQSWLGSFFTD